MQIPRAEKFQQHVKSSAKLGCLIGNLLKVYSTVWENAFEIIAPDGLSRILESISMILRHQANPGRCSKPRGNRDTSGRHAAGRAFYDLHQPTLPFIVLSFLKVGELI